MSPSWFFWDTLQRSMRKFGLSSFALNGPGQSVLGKCVFFCGCFTAYWEPYQIYKHSILDVWQSFEYASGCFTSQREKSLANFTYPQHDFENLWMIKTKKNKWLIRTYKVSIRFFYSSLEEILVRECNFKIMFAFFTYRKQI